MITNTYVCEYRNNLVFEIEGLEQLVAGTPVAFYDKLKQADRRLVGQLDNVLTAAALVHLFSLGFQGTAYFTAQEEAGRSWRYLLEWFRRFGGSTNQLIVVDTSPYSDIGTADKQNVVLRCKDANSEFNLEATQKLESICKTLDISYQFKDKYIEKVNTEASNAGEKLMSLGNTELGRITAASNGLVHGTTLQVPTTGYHTMEESASIEACKAFINILLHLST